MLFFFCHAMGFIPFFTDQLCGHNAYDIENVRAIRMFEFRRRLEEEDSLENKSEVERYLVECCEEDADNFDILAWWKINSPRYRVLSLVARHVLAIPVSTVAFESTFSPAARVLDRFRRSLDPLMVEALICGQNMLSSSPISLRDSMDYVEEFEKLTLELKEGTSSLDPTPTIIVDDMEEA